MSATMRSARRTTSAAPAFRDRQGPASISAHSNPTGFLSTGPNVRCRDGSGVDGSVVGMVFLRSVSSDPFPLDPCFLPSLERSDKDFVWRLRGYRDNRQSIRSTHTREVAAFNDVSSEAHGNRIDPATRGHRMPA